MKNSSSQSSSFPFESWFDFYIKNYKKITLVITIFLLGIIVLLGWTSAKKIRETVIEDFNNQQLVLARYAAAQIENSINILKRELSLLSFSPAVQYYEKVQMVRRIGIVFPRIKEEGAIGIRFVENKNKRTHITDDSGYRIERMSKEDVDYLGWAEWKENKGKIQMSDVSQTTYNDKQKLILRMVLPVWQVSVDEAHPKATNDFSGVLIFVVDATNMVEKIVGGIISGKTGYTWVIDNKGIFLYHPVVEFIGKSAFEARREKKPTISFARINEIQKEMILKGKEGTSWYISGWHRGQEGEIIKKLIAYTPIHWHFDKEDRSHIWSVAVVAPMSEVEGAIRGIQLRQVLLEGIGIIVTLSAGFLIVGILLRWSSTIKKEVDEKTRELKKSEYQCRSLIEHAGDIIYTLDKNGNILSMNSYGYQFLKKEPEEILTHPIFEFFPSESAELQMKEIKDVFEKNVSDQVTCNIFLDGNEYWLSINFSGLLDETGNVYKVLGIARDITERKKIEQQMAHTEKLASVGTLAAGVAHEINNPLTIILGFIDFLLEKTPPDSDAYELMKTIEKQGLNAKRIVENLLGFARFTEHKEVDVDVNKNMESVLAVVGNNLSINKITVNKDLSELLPIVKGDPAELQQVFFNIITNAISVMKGGGILSVMTRAVDDGRKVEIQISDTGTGIPKEYRSKIFDPFFTTKKVGEGTGLGLSISYGIISKHGGTITFETKTKEEAVASGTTFIITLPAAKQI
jgi:PAS domain S-box-containing protein